MNFVGTVEQGKLRVDFQANFERWLMTLEGQRVTIEVKKFRKNRTDAQNRYYWGCVVDILSRSVGLEPEEVHDYIKRRFLPVRSEAFGEIVSGKSTARLTTLEFMELIERVQRWAAQDLQCYIPDPSEEVTDVPA